jgi:hypothetical protein
MSPVDSFKPRKGKNSWLFKINGVYLLYYTTDMHYLYRHIRLDTNQVFYIGVGTKTRQNTFLTIKSEFYRAYDFKKRNIVWKRIAAKTEIKVEIVFESDDLVFIQQKEKEFICLYGRIINNTGSLANLAEGGDSQSFNMNVKVKQLTLENEVVKIWDQLKDIEKELGYLKTNIVKCCRKKQLTAYGYKWEYADNNTYDDIYPSTARKKSQNNRVGIYVTNGTETLLFRTITEVAEKYGYHKSTIQAYISNKRQHKFLKFEYAKWN